MASHIKHDLCVVVGTYRDSQGQEKKRWQKVGVELETEQGGRIILLDRWFNPAGLPDPEGRGTIMLSKFDPKDAQGSREAEPAWNHNHGRENATATPPRASQGQSKPPAADDFTDDIPF